MGRTDSARWRPRRNRKRDLSEPSTEKDGRLTHECAADRGPPRIGDVGLSGGRAQRRVRFSAAFAPPLTTTRVVALRLRAAEAVAVAIGAVLRLSIRTVTVDEE